MQGSWFISHNSLDKDTARVLSVVLVSQGLRPWLDEWEIRPGDQIVHAINVGLDQAEGVIVLWSKNATSSGWVRRELGNAVQRSIASTGAFRVVPVILDDTPLPALLSEIAFVDWRIEESRTAKLLHGVGVDGAGRRALLKGLVHLIGQLGVQPKGMYGILACEKCGSENLQDSESWDEARDAHYGDTTCRDCGWSTGGEI